MKHTVKSVGLADAFPMMGDIRHNADFDTTNGMCFAQWLYGQNIDSHSCDFHGNPTYDGIAHEARERTIEQLKSIAGMLNELEGMEG